MDAGSVLRALGALAAVGLFASLIVIPERSYRLALERRRASARDQVRDYRVVSPDSRYAFDGQTATIVHQEESSAGRRAPEQFSVTIYATNEAGEYFMFISDGVNKPFFKHVEPRMARLVLKDKYREPHGG